MATPAPVLPEVRVSGPQPGDPWRPDSLRRGRSWPDRPADDLSEELLAYTLAPSRTGPRSASASSWPWMASTTGRPGFSWDGEELHNRLDGRTDLSWLSGNLLDRRRTGLWQRLAPGHAGGLVELARPGR
jgi:hypothetical protein